MYSKTTLEHFNNPRNMGRIKDPDGVGEVGNLKCGDVMKIYILVGKRIKKEGDAHRNISQKGHRSEFIDSTEQEEYIEDIKFETLGCAAAIASSSILTELAKGKSLEEAEKISRDDIDNSLGKLPPQKYHCSILSAEAIGRAIADYKSKKGNSNTNNIHK